MFPRAKVLGTTLRAIRARGSKSKDEVLTGVVAELEKDKEFKGFTEWMALFEFIMSIIERFWPKPQV